MDALKFIAKMNALELERDKLKPEVIRLQGVLDALLGAAVPVYDGQHIEIGSKALTAILQEYDSEKVKQIAAKRI